MFFQTKKIKLEVLSEYLKAIRQEAGLSEKNIADKLGISIRNLRALEEGQFEKLPSSVYIRGFLGKLAEIYGVDKPALLRQFEIERGILKNIERAAKAKIQKNNAFKPGLVITPGKISLVGGAIFVGATLFYIIWQVFSIGQVPILEISSPQNLSVIEKSFVEVKGKTDSGSSVSVNNQPVFVSGDGEFSTQVSLSSGPKELVITARNRFNKSTTKTISVIGQSQGTQSEAVRVSMELVFVADVEISYKIDGAPEVKESALSGSVKFLEAKRQILLSAANAGGVKVKVNGQNLGFLGREGEKLADIPFSAESGNIR